MLERLSWSERRAGPRAPGVEVRVVIERAGPMDRAFLAMDRGVVPQQIGIVLVLGGASAFDVSRARRVIGERILAEPRLRQLLVRTPLGCGGPVWVDDVGFDLDRHVHAVACDDPGDDQAVLDVALRLVATRLPFTRPLWSATFVTGLTGERAALVVVLHHALADGVGGLGVLLRLVDGTSPPTAALPFPRPVPTRRELATDAAKARVRALRRASTSLRLLRASMGAGGGLHPPPAEPCSLLQPVGPRRRVAVVRAEIAPLAAAAHRMGATTNDAVLVATAAALQRVLRGRGESVDRVAIGVPVSGRSAGGPSAGNEVGPLLVQVPTSGDLGYRLRLVASEVRATKDAARGPAPIALLGGAFRALAALGAYGWYMNHQQRMHTLVSHVRGPRESLTFDGFPVQSATPVSVADGGNLTVYIQVLSYAGILTLAVFTDPDHVRDSDALTQALRAELDLVTAGASASSE